MKKSTKLVQAVLTRMNRFERSNRYPNSLQWWFTPTEVRDYVAEIYPEVESLTLKDFWKAVNSIEGIVFKEMPKERNGESKYAVKLLDLPEPTPEEVKTRLRHHGDTALVREFLNNGVVAVNTRYSVQDLHAIFVAESDHFADTKVRCVGDVARYLNKTGEYNVVIEGSPAEHVTFGSLKEETVNRDTYIAKDEVVEKLAPVTEISIEINGTQYRGTPEAIRAIMRVS